jgi:hypothetical protein
MSDSLGELEARRRMLKLRCERLRADMSQGFGKLETRIGGVDRVFATLRGFISPSLLISAGGLGFAMFRRARPFMWVTRGVLLFSIVRRILSAVRALRPSRSARR